MGKRMVSGHRSGPPTAYPDKIRDTPLVFTAPNDLHEALQAAMVRLGVSRSDVICALLDNYAEKVQLPRSKMANLAR